MLVGFFCTDIILGELYTITIDFNQIVQFPNLINLGYFTFVDQVSPALWEEIIFRGIMITILLKRLSPRTAITIDGFLFGIFHIDSLTHIIYTFCFGITLAYLYVKTSNLIPCIIAHYVNNILSFLISTNNIPISVSFIQVCLQSFIVATLGLGMIKLYEKLGMVPERSIDK